MKHFHAHGGSREPQQQRGFNRYFSFDDLSDIFEGVNSGQGDQGGAYTTYQFANTEGQQKYDTDTYADIKIPQNLAMNGGQVKVKLSDARTITLKIHPGTKNGQKLRLKGIGKMCPTCDHKGDLIVSIRYL